MNCSREPRSDLSETDDQSNILGFKKGRQYATTWVERAENIGYRSTKYTKIECYVEALKRDPEYAEAWCKLGLQITKMDTGEDTDKELAGMDLFKDESEITDDLDKCSSNMPFLYNAQAYVGSIFNALS